MKVIQYIKINHLFNRVAFASGVILALLAIAIHLPIISNGEQEAQAATGTAQESSLTLAVERDTAALDLNVVSSNGTFATSSESNKAAFSITTNNYTGYTLSISASDDAGTLANGNNSLTSITTNKTLTDTTFDNSDYNGMWGYKPSKYMNGNTVVDNTGTNAVYLISPTTTATTLHVTSAANSTANSYNIALGARADYTKPSGTYSKTFILTAVANKINYSVTYNKNTTDTVTNMPYSNTGNVQSGDTNSTSITLSDLVPVRDGYNFKGWCSVATSDETCSGTTYNPDGAGTNLTYGIDQTTLNIGTLYAMWQSAETKCDGTKLCVQYEGNGLTYDGSKTVNKVNYNSSTSQQEVTKILHSDNVNDSGIATGNSAVNTDQTKEATIDGASSVNVQLYYDTEGVSYDWVTLYAGADSVPSSSNDGTIGSNGNLTGKLGGNKSGYTTSYTTWNLWNNSGNPINSDTIKIHFKTDGTAGSYISYGYYAIITGTGTVLNRTVTSGEYATPTGTDAIFHGWSSTQTTAGAGLPSQVEYTNESEVMSNIPGNNGDTKTLYAVWQQGYNITFNKDSNVSSIAVLDSDGNTVGTITSSGQSLTLAGGDTYTIKPTYTTGYTTNTITKTSGAGTLNGKEFTVGAGATTISVTSKVMQPMQNWTGCSNLAVGDTEQVYDTRDNEAYLVGKLADNKCWLLDNLRLDLVAHKDDLNSTNTNATNEQLAYLKGTSTGTSSDQWAMSGVSYWTSSYSYSAPQIAIKNASDENWNPDTVASVTYGEGSGKIGVYYNYCAASAGTYCWGNGTSSTGSPSSDPKTDTGYDIDGDICPAGWRMPTGGAIATGTIAKGEYQNLYNQYSSATEGQAAAFQCALSTPLSGLFYNGSAYYQGSGGYFWSSTWYNSYSMYGLSVNSSNVYPQNYGNRNGGNSVRCTLQ